MTRVLIADDHPAYRRGLEQMLHGFEGIESPATPRAAYGPSSSSRSLRRTWS
jgi:hypothetical protein